MKLVDYIFFGLYNFYYKDGNYKNDIPWLTVMSIFGAMFFLNISSVLDLFSSKDGYPVEKLWGYVAGVTGVLLSYLIFIRNKRYDLIYNTFRGMNKRERIVNRIASLTYIALSIILFILQL